MIHASGDCTSGGAHVSCSFRFAYDAAGDHRRAESSVQRGESRFAAALVEALECFFERESQK